MLKKILLASILFVSWYYIGVFFPPNITHDINTISRWDWYQIIINFFLAIFTFWAVLTALFKEWIVWLFWKPQVITTTEIIENQNRESNEPNNWEQRNTYVQSYSGQFIIENTWNMSAMNLEVKIESIKFKWLNDADYTNVSILEKSLIWNDDWWNWVINLAPEMRRRIKFCEITAPEQEPDVTSNNSRATLRINGTKDNILYSTWWNWIIECLIHSNNWKSRKETLEIHWSGSWCDRIPEMKNKFSAKLKK